MIESRAETVSNVCEVFALVDQEPLEIQIRPSRATELDSLEEELNPGSKSRYHYARHEVQEKSEGVYLIAWHNNHPVGHFLLRWSGPEKDASGGYPNGVPYLEAGGTKREFRRRGVASRLIEEAEKLVREKDYSRLGLAVGKDDNPDARRLYEKLGFEDWGDGEFEASWDYIDRDGTTGTESETCIYMFKKFRP